MTDPITDILNRIKNAQAVQKETVSIPFSKVKLSIAEILKKEGFITDCKSKGRKIKKSILIDLRYDKEGQPAVGGFKRVSKPGQRIYQRAKEIRKVKSGFGLSIVSTSQGIMTGEQARKKKVGGELMLAIW